MANSADKLTSPTLSSASFNFNERDFISKLLSEKRTLIATLHHEKKEKIRWKELYEQKVVQYEKLQGRIHENPENCSSQFARLSLENEQSEMTDLYQKLREKDEKYKEIKGKNESLVNQVVVLKSEVMRLAGSLSKLDTESVDKNILREQLQLYEQDFNKEKNDRVDAQQKLSILTEQIQENQEMIQTLTVEHDMYKKAYEREKREKENLLARGSSSSDSSRRSTHSSTRVRHQTIPRPQLQIVYPIATTDEQEHEEHRRRRELQQVGVLTRDMQRSPTQFYNQTREENDEEYWPT